ncbi:MAG: carboxymuconolactone decarboxylase family protein [Candidatus Andeanibacterium colombiense]|uniref:Carboxymuconolactone decarboxylase family protein n=1 Tax=Candidatus Andeanibacterium colombiense TaxID=3121345 RepID=A0AAJ5X5H4_9SPHN|nr:MAG: carboxymuconolactone decarboxylase family protein [Sphingomonadaceae bacterium]
MSDTDGDRHQRGLDVLEALGWGHNEATRELDEDLWRIVTETNFGTIWARPGLSLRERELICIAILIARGAHGVAMHFRNATHLGFTDAELKEIVLQTIPYAGLPRAISAMSLLKRTLDGEEPKL